jgi:hypothetical protein
MKRMGTFASLYLIIKKIVVPWFSRFKYAFVRLNMRLRPSSFYCPMSSLAYVHQTSDPKQTESFTCKILVY